jgi:hypothetical protein
VIGLPSFLKRKQLAASAAASAEPLPAAPKPEKPYHVTGEACEKTQDLITGYDGERIGFRKPLQD